MDSDKGQIRFLVTMRPAGQGRADILLKVYREGHLSSETLVSTLKETKARMILLMSRLQLFRLGYEEHVPSLPRIAEFRLEAA